MVRWLYETDVDVMFAGFFAFGSLESDALAIVEA